MQRKPISVLVGLLAAFGLALAVIPPANASDTHALLSGSATAPQAGGPIVQFCTVNTLWGGTTCMNAGGGNHQVGGWVIAYNFNDPNNTFAPVVLRSWCGNTGWVHNGENGQVCPFTVGSGLNARYDGDPIVGLQDYISNNYATIPNFSNGLVTEGHYGDSGYAWVISATNFIVSVGRSNNLYSQTHQTNNPAWLRDWAQRPGSQLQVQSGSGAGDEPWVCYGTGVGDIC